MERAAQNPSEVLYPQPHCPKCGCPLRLIDTQWYCDKCKMYPEILPISPVSRYGTVEGERKFWNRFLSSTIILIGLSTIVPLAIVLYYLLRYGLL